MDAFDVFTVEPSTTQTNSLPEVESTDEAPWFTENAPPSDDITSSPAFNGNPFDNDEQLNTFPPTAEDILSDHSTDQSSDDKSTFNIFSAVDFSPLQGIDKKREEEIAVKDAEETRKIAILREQAKTDKENWYNERQRQLDQKLEKMKTAEDDFHAKALETSSKQSCDWSKVLRLIDFTDGKQSTRSKRDLTRMKECIFNAKRFNEKKKLTNGN